MFSFFVQALSLRVFLSPSHAHSLPLSFFSRSIRGFWTGSQGASNRDQSMREVQVPVPTLSRAWSLTCRPVSCRLLGPFLWCRIQGPQAKQQVALRAFKCSRLPPSSWRTPRARSLPRSSGTRSCLWSTRRASRYPPSSLASRYRPLVQTVGHLSLPSFFSLGSINEK